MAQYMTGLDIPGYLQDIRNIVEGLRAMVKDGDFSSAKRQWNDYFGDYFCCLAMYPAVKVWTFPDGKDYMPERVCGLFVTKLPAESFLRPGPEGEELRKIDELVAVSRLQWTDDPGLARKGLRDCSVFVRYRDEAGEWVKEVHLPEEECPRWGWENAEQPAERSVPDWWREFPACYLGDLKTEV